MKDISKKFNGLRGYISISVNFISEKIACRGKKRRSKVGAK
jgi:hypothetical protein